MDDVVPVDAPVVRDVDAEQVEHEERGAQRDDNREAVPTEQRQNHGAPDQHSDDLDLEPDPLEAVREIRFKELAVAAEQEREDQDQNEQRGRRDDQHELGTKLVGVRLRAADDLVRGIERFGLRAHGERNIRRVFLAAQGFQRIAQRVRVVGAGLVAAEYALQRPVLLLVEDLHNAAAALEQVVEALGQRGRVPVRVVRHGLSGGIRAVVGDRVEVVLGDAFHIDGRDRSGGVAVGNEVPDAAIDLDGLLAFLIRGGHLAALRAVVEALEKARGVFLVDVQLAQFAAHHLPVGGGSQAQPVEDLAAVRGKDGEAVDRGENQRENDEHEAEPGEYAAGQVSAFRFHSPAPRRLSGIPARSD